MGTFKQSLPLLFATFLVGTFIAAEPAGILGTQEAWAQTATCTATPAFDCRRSAKGGVQIAQKDAGAKDKLTFKWIKGDATVIADFGDPTSTTGYALCVYAGTHSALVASAQMDADPTRWSTAGSKGFKYKDKAGTPHGIQKVLIKSGDQGKAKALVKGKGINLPDPVLPSELPLRVQLINSANSVCFEDVFDGGDIKKLEANQVKGTSGEEDPLATPEVLRFSSSLPRTSAGALGIPDFVGAPAVDAPIAPLAIPVHPLLDNGGDSRIHNDHYNSAVYNRDGPRGNNMTVTTSQLVDASINDLTNVCAMLTFTEDGYVVGACINANLGPPGSANTRLIMMDPVNLNVYADVVVAPRPLIQNSAGGAYFSIDSDGRYVIGPANNAVEIWQLEINGGKAAFVRMATYDVSVPLSAADMLQDTVVDYDGRLWFCSIEGIVGYYDPATDILETFDTGEGLQNSFAVDDEGVYVVTYDAMYKFSVDVDDTVKQDWRTPYDNTGPGILQPGSGTTPTLFGSLDDLVGFADTAVPQINMVILDRTTGANVCLTPLFRPNESGAENTFITYEDEVVVVNNAGFTGAFAPQNTIYPGLEKYSVRADRTGCDVEWINHSAFGNSAQLSTTTGLIYGWGPDVSEVGFDAYYLTAHDWATGAEVFRKYGGNDLPFNPVTGQAHLGPDGTAYFGSLWGVIRMADGP